MTQINVFHYTSIANAGTILGLRQEPGILSGLEPRRIVATRSSDNSTIKASFALLDPLGWLNNEFCPGVWNHLKPRLKAAGHTAALLEISVDPEADNITVADRAHMEGYYRHTLFEASLPRGYLYYNPQEAALAFVKSAIPLSNYLKDGNHLLPEVLIHDHIQPEKIKVSNQQPLLEEDLAGFANWGDIRDQIVHNITEGWIRKELMPWREKYEAQNGPLILTVGKERS